MDPCRSNIGGGPDPCDPCGVDAYELRLSRDRDGATAKQLQACIGVSRNDMDTYCATVELATKTQKASASATNSTMHLAPRRLEIGPCRLCKTEVSLKAFFQS